MPDDERPDTAEPLPYEAPAIKDIEQGDAPLETTPGTIGSPGGGIG